MATTLIPPPDLEDPPPDPEALIEEARRRTRRRHRRTAAALVLALGLVAAGYAALAGSGSSQPSAATAHVRTVASTARTLGGDVAFSLGRHRQPSQVYLLHADGRVSQITRGAAASEVEGWSPDGSQLLVDRYRQWNGHTWAQRLYVVRPDGHGWVPLSPPAALRRGASIWEGAGAWSPDGSHIAFELGETGPPPGYRSRHGVVVVGWDGTRITSRVWLRGWWTLGLAPWSPDGTRLALTRGTTRTSSTGEAIEEENLHIVTADGSSDITLTRTGRSTCREGPERKGMFCQGYFQAAWSADGSSITANRSTYLGNNTERTEIVRVTPAGSDHVAAVRVLRAFTSRAHAPNFLGLPSPTSSLFSVASSTGVYTIRSDGTHLRRLLRIRPIGAPRWSGDGSRMIFFSLQKGHCRLSTVTADGSSLVQLDPSGQPFPSSCSATVGGSGPFWRPRRSDGGVVT